MFVGGQSQNLALQSQTIATGSAFTAPWTESHTVSVSTVSVSGVLAPDGTAAAQVNFPAVSGSDFSVFYQSFAGTATTWSASCMAKAVSGTPSFYLMMTPGGTYRSAICAPTTSAWTRCYVTGAVTAATWYLQIGVDKRDGGQANQSAGSVYLSDCQLEPNPAPTLCHSTLGSPYSGTATAASTPVTLTNPARWCVGTKLVATNSWFVISPAAYLWAIGSGDISVTPAANNAALYSYGSPHRDCDTYDGSNNERVIDYQPSWTAGTSHTLIGCNAGTLQLWADGAQVGSPSGTGTASIDWTTASTAHIQSNGSGAKQFNGSVQKFCQGNTYAAVSSCLSAP